MINNYYYIIIKRSFLFYFITEKDLVQKFKAQEIDMMYRKHIQRQNAHLLDNKAVVPLTPVTSPSTRNRKVKPGKVFTDRADTPTIG